LSFVILELPDFSNWKDHDSYQTAFQRLGNTARRDALRQDYPYIGTTL